MPPQQGHFGGSGTKSEIRNLVKLDHTLNKRPILDSRQVFLIPTPKCFLSCQAVSHLDSGKRKGSWMEEASQGHSGGHRGRSCRERGGNRCAVSRPVQSSRSVVSDSLWPHGLQHARLSCPSPTPRACSNSCPSSRWCYPITHSLSSPSSPAFNLSQHQGLFQWVCSLHQMAKVLEFQLQHQSFQWIFRADFL